MQKFMIGLLLMFSLSNFVYAANTNISVNKPILSIDTTNNEESSEESTEEASDTEETQASEEASDTEDTTEAEDTTVSAESEDTTENEDNSSTTANENKDSDFKVINGKSVASKFVYDGDIIINGVIDCSSFKVNGNVIINGDLKCASTDIVGNLYVYGNIDGSTIKVSNKLKVTKDVNCASLVGGRLYTYGQADASSVIQKKESLKGIASKLDPFLNIETEKEEIEYKLINDYVLDFNQTKGELDKEYKSYQDALRKKIQPTNINKIAQLKSELLSIQKDFFAKISNYIEKNPFDKKGFEKVKNDEINNLNKYLGIMTLVASQVSAPASVAPIPQEANPTTNNNVAVPVLPKKFQDAINAKINSLPEDKKKLWLETIIDKLDVILQKKSLTTAKRNLILGLQNFLSEQLNNLGADENMNIDELLTN